MLYEKLAVDRVFEIRSYADPLLALDRKRANP